MSISQAAGQSKQGARPAWAILIGLIFGIVFIATGIIVGNQSHQVVYQSVSNSTIAHYIIGDNGTDYMQMTSSPNLYIVNENDFTPHIDGSTLGNNISFLYQPDTTTKIDVSDVAGNHLSGGAYTVLQITVQGNNQTMFNTAKYTQNPNGYYSNHWLIGIGLIAVGVLLAIVALFSPFRALYLLGGTLGGTLLGAIGIPFIVLDLIGFDFPTPFSLQIFLDINPWIEPLAIVGAVIGLIIGVIAAIVAKI